MKVRSVGNSHLTAGSLVQAGAAYLKYLKLIESNHIYLFVYFPDV